MLIRYENEKRHHYDSQGRESHTSNSGYGIYEDGRYIPFPTYTNFPDFDSLGMLIPELNKLKSLCKKYSLLCEEYSKRIQYRIETILIEKETMIFTEDKKLSDHYNLYSLNIQIRSLVTHREYERGFGGRDCADVLEGLQEEITDLIRVACSDEKIRKLQTGFYDVVLDSEATGLLVHEFIGHLFEADNELIDKNEINSNKTVAIPQVTVIDDPTLKGGFGTYRFDDEGTVARATQIIKNGKMNSLLHSQKTGQLAGVASTSNARAIDYTQLPLVRMSNTYMLPDSSHTPKDLIQSIEYGIYAKGTRDSKSGINAVAGFREMYLVKDGEIGECIANMNIIGTPLSILGKIQMIANDFNIFGGGNGGCIKKGQGPLNVSSGGPHVKLHNVMLFPRLNDSFKSNNQV